MINFHTLARLLLLTGLVTLSGACAVNPATGENDLVLMSESQEIAIGRQTHADILQAYGEYDNPELAAYVQKIGDRVAKNSHRQDLIYRFTVLDTPQVNAFALPGGYIYVTRGILAYLNTEDELAAVLGHEIGHVTARHAVRRHSTATVTGIAGAILASQAGVQGAEDVINILGTALVRGYGREHELEADRLGARYLAQTGYEPDAMLDVIKLLKNQELFENELARLEKRKPRTYHGLFATHPKNDVRLQTAIKESHSIKAGAIRRDKDRDEFLALMDGMVFGNSTREGVVRGEHFYHHDLDFTLKFPGGWRIKNQPHRVMATPAANDGLIVLTVQDRNRRITPRQFMQERLQLDNLKSGEQIKHNGMTGYTALTRTDTDFGPRLARVVVLYHGKRAYIVAGTAKNKNQPYKYDDLILNTARSFRALEAEERELGMARKLRVKKFTGQSYRELAEDSGLNHLAESQIRLLNGHYPSGAPASGNLIKTIE